MTRRYRRAATPTDSGLDASPFAGPYGSAGSSFDAENFGLLDTASNFRLDAALPSVGDHISADGGLSAAPTTEGSGAMPTDGNAMNGIVSGELPGMSPMMRLGGSAVLPEAAADLLDELREASHLRHAAMMSVQDDMVELRFDRQKAQNDIDSFPGHFRDDGNAPELLRRRAKVTALSAKIAKLEKRHEERSAEWSAVSRPVGIVDQYLKGFAGAKFEMYAKPVAPKPGETVESLRARIGEVRDTLQATRMGPRPSGDVKARAKAQIETLAERGRPGVRYAVNHGEEIAFPTEGTGVNRYAQVGDGMALTAWLFKPQLIAAVEREIDEFADDAIALNDTDRVAKEGKILAELLEIERRECALVASAGGIYREDADPRAILGITGPSPVKPW